VRVTRILAGAVAGIALGVVFSTAPSGWSMLAWLAGPPIVAFVLSLPGFRRQERLATGMAAVLTLWLGASMLRLQHARENPALVYFAVFLLFATLPAGLVFAVAAIAARAAPRDRG
jgi:hypothetical protein